MFWTDSRIYLESDGWNYIFFSFSTRFWWEYSKILNLKIRSNLKRSFHPHGRNSFTWEDIRIGRYELMPSRYIRFGYLFSYQLGCYEYVVTWVYVGDVIRIHEEISEDFHIKDGHTLWFISLKRFIFHISSIVTFFLLVEQNNSWLESAI